MHATPGDDVSLWPSGGKGPLPQQHVEVRPRQHLPVFEKHIIVHRLGRQPSMHEHRLGLEFGSERGAHAIVDHGSSLGYMSSNITDRFASG